MSLNVWWRVLQCRCSAIRCARVCRCCCNVLQCTFKIPLYSFCNLLTHALLAMSLQNTRVGKLLSSAVQTQDLISRRVRLLCEVSTLLQLRIGRSRFKTCHHGKNGVKRCSLLQQKKQASYSPWDLLCVVRSIQQFLPGASTLTHGLPSSKPAFY